MDPKFLRAEELGIRLEMVGGLPIWEPHLSGSNQKPWIAFELLFGRLIRILTGVSDCSCVHAADVYLSSPTAP
jgi:hypothetical protein